MKRPVIITGLDLGSSKICAVSVELDGSGAHAILGMYSGQSRGIERGHIVDLNAAVDSVSRALGRLAEKTSAARGHLFVNISGRTVTAQKTRGMVSLSMRGREITNSDMERCVGVASTIRLPLESDIVHKIVHSYTIDDQTQTLMPQGLYGSRLAVELYVIIAHANQVQNINKVVSSCGYDVEGVVFSGIADALSLLDEEGRRRTIFMADLGSDLLEASVYQEGILKGIEVMPFGTSDVKGDLAADQGLRDVLSRIRRSLDAYAAKGLTVDGGVLAGGGSLVDGMVEAFEAALGFPVRPGTVKDLAGNISYPESVIATTAIGLVRHGCSVHAPRVRQNAGGIVRGISSRVVDIFNNYF